MKPEVIAEPERMQEFALAARRLGKRIAFVPTMGYLHEGHAALLREARKRGDLLVLSIFVNPTQFGPTEDLSRYPRDMERDLAVAADTKTDLVFAPEPAAIYPPGYSSYVEVGGVAEPLEGEKRPGHFRGVATVVLKLFQLVQPHVAVFGEKDWQQLAVIRRMVADLSLPVEIVGHPIVREKDGLALSSRNSYLSPAERARALCLSRALAKVEALYARGERSAKALLSTAAAEIAEDPSGSPPVKADYVAIVDPDTMRQVDPLPGRALIALAVRVGSTRLIDNRLLVA